MGKFESLKKNADFGRVYRQGRSYGNRLLVMYVIERGQGQEDRVGFSVSKKVGNSVVRHRVKRVLREVFRTHPEGWKAGLDIVVIARREASDKGFRELEGAVLRLAAKLNIVTAVDEKGNT